MFNFNCIQVQALRKDQITKRFTLPKHTHYRYTFMTITLLILPI